LNEIVKLLLQVGGDAILPRASRHPFSPTSRAVASNFAEAFGTIKAFDLERNFHDKENTLYKGHLIVSGKKYLFLYSRSNRFSPAGDKRTSSPSRESRRAD